jgi:hypothetical protein
VVQKIFCPLRRSGSEVEPQRRRDRREELDGRTASVTSVPLWFKLIFCPLRRQEVKANHRDAEIAEKDLMEKLPL